MPPKKSVTTPAPKKSAAPKKAAAAEAPAKIAAPKKAPAKAAAKKAPPTHAEIANLAERYWVERGRPYGSAEHDWLRAERELREGTE